MKINLLPSKVCVGCQTPKPQLAFHVDRKMRDRLKKKCKTCTQRPGVVAASTRRYRDNVGGYRDRVLAGVKARQTPAVKRAQHLHEKYGITTFDFDDLLAAQGGRCGICKTDKPVANRGGLANGWCVDHDHSTGKIRGVLCQGCNTGLGSFRDSADALTNAAAYLRGVK